MKGSKRMYEIVEAVLGGGFEEKVKNGEHLHKKIEKPPYMPLVVEAWHLGDKTFVSVSHYSEQNGDAMADPDILFFVSENYNLRKSVLEKVLIPVEYRNDYFGVRQVCVYLENDEMRYSPHALADTLRFVQVWAENLKEQGFISKP